MILQPSVTSPPGGETGALPDIPANLAGVRAQISKAAEADGRSATDVRLVAVSKTFSAPRIRSALAAGQRVFGENRVQEAEEKWPALRDAFPDVRLHLIGPLQTNKARRACALFDVIQTVDRPKLARAIAREIRETGKMTECFVQVNTGAEPQKAGVSPDQADDFVAFCRTGLNLPVKGLMCVPPVDEEASPHFALLREMAKRNGLAGLSMGMSADFETAVRFGATHVRVGSGIFGDRARKT